MCATYRDKQKRSHFESFANKIFTGIREIKPEYAEKRAVWELFQNALDTVESNGVIEIAKTEKGLHFKHNGRPFTDDEFGGLIKQFSVGKAYGDNTEKVGQYGTGFISTHVYGKIIIVNGSIKTDDGSYRLLQDFKLDRDAGDIDQLTDKLLAQDHNIESLCENIQLSKTEPLGFTVFEYQSNQNNHVHIDSMLGYVQTILPFIFCFNDKLEEVRLCLGETNEVYKRVGEKDGVIQLMKNKSPINIPMLQNEDGSIRVILGSPKLNLKDIPKLFLYYPLMDTAEAGINFLMHAKDFKPNKERDFLYKSKDNEELKDDVEKNESLMRKAYDLVLDKICHDKSLEAIDTSNILFTSSDSEFEKQLKCDYIGKIKSLEIIDIGSKRHPISSIQYFDSSILSIENEEKKAVYDVLSQFRMLPPLAEYCRLSELVNNWNGHIEEKMPMFEMSDIAHIIVSESGGDYFYIQDKLAYQKVISEIAKDISLLNQYELIPNVHGGFRALNGLVKWDQPEPSLVNVVDTIAASVTEKFIHDDFIFLNIVSDYSRVEFKDDFSKYCNELVESLAKGRDAITLESPRYVMLTTSLTAFVGLNKKTPLNIEIVTFYQRIFALEPKEDLQLSEPATDVNYYPAIKLLAHLYIKCLQNTKLKDKLGDLKEIVAAMFRNSSLKEELLHKLTCIPNQDFLLKSQTELNVDGVLDEDFKDQYREITGENCRDGLAYDGFGQFLQHNGSVSGLQLGGEMESAINSDRKFIPVEVTTIVTVLKLIEKISEKPATWGQWLPNINKVKEEILMNQFQNGKTRSSLFSILTKDEKTIELLGELAKVEDLAELIRKGREKQQEDKRRDTHLSYINKIGLQIQDIIEAQLGFELAAVVSIMKSEDDTELNTQEEQNGQDFIIYKNKKPIYYLEVKSKWDENGRFALSKNQTEKCAAKKNDYAVISVNVDRYKRHNSISTDDILFEDLKSFVKVNDDLGEHFEKLVSENITKAESNDPKLIEYRGSIPQKVIDEQGADFDSFILKLIQTIKVSNPIVT
jgi:Domain of unknown function (DUF3883)